MQGDSPDWSHLQNAGGVKVFDQTDNVGGAGTAPVIAYVGLWASLTVIATVPPGSVKLWKAVFEWSFSSTLASVFATTTIEAEDNGNGVATVDVVAPYVRLTFLPYVGTDAGAIEITAYGSSYGAAQAQPGIGGTILEAVAVNINPGATATFKPTAIVNNLVTLTVWSGIPAWTCIVERLDSAGVLQGIAAYTTSAGQQGQTIRFGLPPRRMRVRVTNIGSAADVFYVWMSIDNNH